MKTIDTSSDEFYKDYGMNKPDNSNILIEYFDQAELC